MIKISPFSQSKTPRIEIVNMITEIQKKEFSIAVTAAHNMCILEAEQTFYYNNLYNFWYAHNKSGTIIGSIGLKRVNEKSAEIKKFFVHQNYRGSGLAQKLMQILITSAQTHRFQNLFLGTVSVLKAAHRFYEKNGFNKITVNQLPKEFELCDLDSVFYQKNLDLVMKSKSYQL